jgi:hypothetical protein
MKSLCRALVVLASLCISVNAYAGETFEFIHKPQLGDTLPPPGERFPLSVVVQGTRRIDLAVRALIVRDGKLMETPLVGTLDEQDRAIYSTEIHVPLAEVSYQFILYPPNNGTPLLSKRFVLRRRCIPNITLTDLTPTAATAEEDPAQTALQRARDLERDLNQLDAVVQILGDIQAVLQEQK